MQFIVAALIAAVAAECGDPLVTKLNVFEDDKCATAVKDKEDDIKKMLDTVNEGAKKMVKCTQAGSIYMKLSCTTDSAVWEYFEDKECSKATDAPKDSKQKDMKWGECTEMGPVYVKITGANA